MWRGTSTLQALSQNGGEMETSRYFSSLASGRRSRGPGQPGVSPEQLPSHRGVCRAIRLDGASVPEWVLWAPLLGLPWRRSRDGASSLIPAGPSLSLFGIVLVLQHHVGDEYTHKQEQQEAGGQWDSNGIGSGQEILVDDMLTVDEWQENYPGGVISEDDQAKGDEAESHHLVCSRGLQKREDSTEEKILHLGRRG